MNWKSFGRSLFLLSMGVWIVCCAPDYKDISSVNGRRAILEEADNFLTNGNCESAIEVLQPLISSPHADYEAYMKWASAHACKGGVNFPNLIAGFTDLGTAGIWGMLVKTNYSESDADGKRAALLKTSDILLATAQPAGNLSAAQRTKDANLMMVFTHINAIGTTIGPLGKANRTTGAKTQSISGQGTAYDKCVVQTALFFIDDSLDFVGSSKAVTTISEKVSLICSALPGGKCPSNGLISSCLNDAGLQAVGQLLINAIDAQW